MAKRINNSWRNPLEQALELLLTERLYWVIVVFLIETFRMLMIMEYWVFIFILLVVYSLINSFRVNRYIFICLLVILFQAIVQYYRFAYTGSIFGFFLEWLRTRA